VSAPEVITLDWETFPITSRPQYPPDPVGLAIRWPGDPPFYMAFGHQGGNTCERGHVKAMLAKVWNSDLPVLFHHAKFDLAVCEEKFGMAPMPWARVHDTMFLSYLCDPHARSLGLKELADDILAWPPEERDELAEWVWEHRAELQRLAPLNGNVTRKGVGKWIWAAPAEMVGTYAVGDVARTWALFEHLWPIVQENGMGVAYDRERRLLPILMENERIGMRVDMEGLGQASATYGAALIHAEVWLRNQLHASGLNFDADADVASVLLSTGVVPAENWTMTSGGKSGKQQLSMAKDALRPEMFSGRADGLRIASVLGYRNRLVTCLNMFIDPWLEQAELNHGYITTSWNQVRNAGGGGTRTGRPSTDHHNFLNISKSFDGRDDGYVHPYDLDVPPLPLCRQFVLPDPGDVFLHRDFDGQELRVFAEVEQGALWAQYQANPALDPHAFIGTELMRVAGREIERTKVKVMNFQSLYGGGIPALQKALRCSVVDAKQLKAFHDKALPGRKLVNEEIKRLCLRGLPIRTLGGRLYFPEEPGPDGRSKIYKLINYWVQGSAADLTKEALIDWHDVPWRRARFLVTVYDEINVSAPVEQAAAEMALLREVMERDRLSVPMRSSGKQGPSWGELIKCE